MMAIGIKSTLIKHIRQPFCPTVTGTMQVRNKKKFRTFKQFRRKNDSQEIAKDYFDINYEKIFKNEWPAIRCAMLSRQKYCAVLNNFVATERYEEQLVNSGAYDFISDFRRKAELKQHELERSCSQARHELESALSKTADDVEQCDNSNKMEIELNIAELESKIEDLNIEISNYKRLKMSCLGVQAYVYQKSDFTEFKEAMDNFFYLSFLLDGSSILPVLALDPRPSDSILDMCSAPGAKLSLMIQARGTSDNIVANDISISKMNGIVKVLQKFYPSSSRIVESLTCKTINAMEWSPEHIECFSKVLVDVPCIADRKSMYTPENETDNIFSEARKRERARLPEIQSILLMNAIKACQIGGNIVYTTTTASPLQNQYVVQFTVQEALQIHKIVCEVEDLSSLTSLLKEEFHFQEDLELGALIVPRLDANFGPTYVCKLKRIT